MSASGYVEPGMTVVENLSGKTERVLSGSEFDLLSGNLDKDAAVKNYRVYKLRRLVYVLKLRGLRAFVMELRRQRRFDVELKYRVRVLLEKPEAVAPSIDSALADGFFQSSNGNCAEAEGVIATEINDSHVHGDDHTEEAAA